MDKCEELVPEYYSFVKGVVDTDDLSLNISRETLQNDRHVIAIAKALESKIHSELKDMLENDFENYKKLENVEVRVGEYHSCSEALKILKECEERYNEE